jgi:hypothetical protein
MITQIRPSRTPLLLESYYMSMVLAVLSTLLLNLLFLLRCEYLGRRVLRAANAFLFRHHVLHPDPEQCYGSRPYYSCKTIDGGLTRVSSLTFQLRTARHRRAVLFCLFSFTISDYMQHPYNAPRVDSW